MNDRHTSSGASRKTDSGVRQRAVAQSEGSRDIRRIAISNLLGPTVIVLCAIVVLIAVAALVLGVTILLKSWHDADPRAVQAYRLLQAESRALTPPGAVVTDVVEAEPCDEYGEFSSDRYYEHPDAEAVLRHYRNRVPSLGRTPSEAQSHDAFDDSRTLTFIRSDGEVPRELYVVVTGASPARVQAWLSSSAFCDAAD